MTPQHMLTTAVMLAAIFGAALAVGQDYAVDWWTVDGGGDAGTTGGDYELSATIGQPDAGAVMTGGDFELVGGFWVAVTPVCLGDCNCDGVINFDDINALVAALSDPDGVCFFPNIDMDFSGVIDFDDINPFVEILSGSGGPCP